MSAVAPAPLARDDDPRPPVVPDLRSEVFLDGLVTRLHDEYGTDRQDLRTAAVAALAELPSITGLDTTIMCLLGYAVFGPSRILVLGPDSSLGPMIAATIVPLISAGGDQERAVALASVLALMVAAIMIVAGWAGLGF